MKMYRNKAFTYNVVVTCGSGNGNFFNLLPEQLTLAPTPCDSSKYCSSQTHSLGQGVMLCAKLMAQKRATTNTIINDFIAAITVPVCRRILVKDHSEFFLVVEVGFSSIYCSAGCRAAALTDYRTKISFIEVSRNLFFSLFGCYLNI